MADTTTVSNAGTTLRIATASAIVLLVAFAAWLLVRLFGSGNSLPGLQVVAQALRDPMFWSAAGVGLLAQAIDGALGMAYGVTSSSFLLATGAPPLLASGATHLAEVFTTGISGIAHTRMGNVDRRLFLCLLLPGVIGALVGTQVLGRIDGHALKPWISLYLLLMGLYVLGKAFGHRMRRPRPLRPGRIAPLALFGSFMDVTGGGGWGPLVTTSLVGAGHDPRTTIGSVNFAEFFLTLVTAVALSSVLDGQAWVLVAGLVAGGAFAAPLAARITRYLQAKTLLMMVGTLISVISAFNLWQALA